MTVGKEDRSGGWREWGIFAPRPRRWSSALTLAALAVLLAFVVPPTGMRMGSRSMTFMLYKVNGQYQTDYAAHAEEHWTVSLAWTSQERHGRASGQLRTSVSRVDADRRVMPPPSPAELRAALSVGADEESRDDPLLLRAIQSGSAAVSEWRWRGVVAEVGHWAIKFMLLGALVLGLVRMVARRSYERAIGAWYEGKCPSCGYVLEGISTERCPECGCVGEERVKRLDGILRGR